jgi:hypothetical protein
MSWVNYDDDDLDLMVANYGGSNTDAYRNDGDCRLSNVAQSIGFDSDRNFTAGTPFGHAWADYDNDGDLDAFETNIGHPRYDAQGTDHSRLLCNTRAPNYRFENAVDSSGIAYVEGDISSAWGDYDRDGDLDLLIGPRGNWQLFRNDARNDNHWIEVRVEQPTGNTDALGARITVAQTVGGAERTQLREVSGGEAVWATRPSRVRHFGLGTNTGSVTVRVRCRMECERSTPRWRSTSGIVSSEA